METEVGAKEGVTAVVVMVAVEKGQGMLSTQAWPLQAHGRSR